MIQTNVPGAPAKLKGLINRPDSVDVLFANGSFTAPGGHPTALVRRNIANGSMTNEDLAGGFLQSVRSREDSGSNWRKFGSPTFTPRLRVRLRSCERPASTCPVSAPGRSFNMNIPGNDRLAALRDRVHKEFQELPAVHLTRWQAARLSGVEPAECDSVMKALLAAKVLRETRGGYAAGERCARSAEPTPSN